VSAPRLAVQLAALRKRLVEQHLDSIVVIHACGATREGSGRGHGTMADPLQLSRPRSHVRHSLLAVLSGALWLPATSAGWAMRRRWQHHNLINTDRLPTTVPRAASGGEPVPRRQATRSPSSKVPPASAAATCKFTIKWVIANHPGPSLPQSPLVHKVMGVKLPQQGLIPGEASVQQPGCKLGASKTVGHSTLQGGLKPHQAASGRRQQQAR
jgi:hypothetical protein